MIQISLIKIGLPYCKKKSNNPYVKSEKRAEAKSRKYKNSTNLYVISQLLESTRTSDFFFTVRGKSQQGESDTKFLVGCHIS